MAQEGFCPTHGPYDARSGSCPYCQRGGVGGQGGGDDTRVFSGSGSVRDDVDDLPTEVGWMRGGKRAAASSDEETQIPVRRRTGGAARVEDADDTVIESRIEGMLGWLIVKRGQRRGQVFAIRSGSTIGRKGTDIVLNDPKLTRLHAKIGVRSDQFVVADVLSENGTYVNGERIQGERVLAENDEVRVGDTVLVLKVLPAEQQ